ncbi:MAG: cytidine deaminase [Candidatus Acidiferrales bacterium]
MTAAQRRLLTRARQARKKAFAPYSKFKVGAAVETQGGRVYTGANVENATYGLTVCAERVAILYAVSQGERRFKRVAVAADSKKLTGPCGACRQIIWEFCGNAEVILGNLKGKTAVYRMKDLFPLPFDNSYL